MEFATLIAGPFCGLTLADLGADVVKLEPARGDEGRAFRPFAPNGESAFFHALNRGKRSAIVDAADARRVAERADVVIENAPERLDFGPDDMPERLVWCSVTGEGYRRGGRAMDPTLQATMGLMELTGEPDGPPLRVPVPLIDFMTGMYAAQSVLAALWRVERTGTGAHLDCALLDSAATLTSTVALFSLSGEFEPSRIGTQSYLRVPSAVFAAADGDVQVIALHEAHWEALCAALERPEWRDDPRFATGDARLENRELVNERIASVIASASADEWVARINGAGGMCQRLRSLGDAWRDPVLAERGLVGELDGGSFDFPLPVVSLARPDRLRPGPSLGQHTDEVLAEL